MGLVAAKSRVSRVLEPATSAQRHVLLSTSSARPSEPPDNGTAAAAAAATATATDTDTGTWDHLRVNEARLLETLHATCAWGTGTRWGAGETETGMARAALTDADGAARDWFRTTTAALGCDVAVDAVGNMFAARPGRRPGPPVCAGSHLDTQPAGGRYDGVLGVVAGVEMLRVLRDHGVVTEYPVGVVNWTKYVSFSVLSVACSVPPSSCSPAFQFFL